MILGRLDPSIGFWFNRRKNAPSPTPAGWWGPSRAQEMTFLRFVASKRPYRPDITRFGGVDYWVPDSEGDCEDKALWLLINLALDGWPISSMSVLVGTVRQAVKPRFVCHAVPAVLTTEYGWMVGDYLMNRVMALSDMSRTHIWFSPEAEIVKSSTGIT